MKTGDCSRVSTFVAVTPDAAFEVFTQETDFWWKRGPRYRCSQTSTVLFEGGAGGRLIEDTFEIGKILVWEPGRRLVFEWRGRDFAEGEITQVEVRFEKMRDGTQVTIEHSGWDKIRETHPARHGLDGSAFSAMMGMWWAELATFFRVHASKKDA